MTRNINVGIETADRFWRKWNIPAFSPHAHSVYAIREGLWNPKDDHEYVMAGDLSFVAKSDALYLIPGWEDSHGAQMEIAYARSLGIASWESELALVDWVKREFKFLPLTERFPNYEEPQ
jgi:hypothetical protein